MGDIGALREADGKSRQQFCMKYRGAKQSAKPSQERSYRPALDTAAAHKSGGQTASDANVKCKSTWSLQAGSSGIIA